MIIDAQKLYLQIEKETTEQRFSNVYSFFGDEPYLVQQATNYLKVCALHGGMADFNLTQYFSSEFDYNKFRDEIDTLPVMAPRRVVIVREAQDLTDKEWDQVCKYILNPQDSALLILSGTKIDKRKKFYKVLTEQTVFAEFKKPFESQIPTWIKHIAKGLEIEIEPAAVNRLHQLAGSSLTEIDAELKKIKEFVGKNTVTEGHVNQCVTKKKSDDVFSFIDTVAQGDLASSLFQLIDLLENGQNESGVISLIARHVRILMSLQEGQELGYVSQRLATHAQIPSYFLKKYLEQSKKWDMKKLKKVLILLADTDKALKTSPLSSHIWLENFVLKSCAISESARV
jgi:DNA polymerase-3 subunit delta